LDINGGLKTVRESKLRNFMLDCYKKILNKKKCILTTLEITQWKIGKG
jgi:hypothetical protein